MNRRKFLNTSSWISASALAPQFIRQLDVPNSNLSRSGKNLVIIQLSGGNDGLNTVIPYQNDTYSRLRKDLAISGNQLLKLDDHQALNPNLKGMKSLYDQGEVCILNSVGYPNPDRSHFRSMDIWQTGSGSDKTLQNGWLGRYLDSSCSGRKVPYHALDLSEDLNLALKGTNQKGFVLTDSKFLNKTIQNPILKNLSNKSKSAEFDHRLTNYLYKTLVETISSTEYLVEQANHYSSPVEYPNTVIAKDLNHVAKLITNDLDTKIYYVSLSGFDTHARQLSTHNRLLGQYDEAVSAFIKDLKHHDLFEDTLIMTFSEFGRRVEVNGSQGTDHGTANNVFLAGGKLHQPGLFNQAPNLDNLDNGDLIFEIDFRQIYAEILDKWLEADSSSILFGEFNPLELI